MATSDYPDKDYKYAGMIVCSGITTGTSTDIGKTNVAKALGITDAQAKESKYAKLGTNSPDCIDPTVLYDHDGNLWMVYGSFTTAGGIPPFETGSKDRASRSKLCRQQVKVQLLH